MLLLEVFLPMGVDCVVISYKDFLRTLFFNSFPNTGAPFYRDSMWFV